MSQDNSYQNQIYKTSTLALVVIFSYFLMVMRCWLGFGGAKQIMIYSFPFIMAFLVKANKMRCKFKKRYFIYSLIVFIAALLRLRGSLPITAIINEMFIPIGILFVLCIPDNEKDYILGRFIKWYGCIMVLGIPLYLIGHFVTLPSLGTVNASYSNASIVREVMLNYIFYLKPLSVDSSLGFNRFNGPCIEPGDIACTAAFLLMAAKFDFKRYKMLWGVFAGLFFSFSLAGYMLALIGYLFCLFKDNKISLSRFYIFIFVVLGFYWYGTSYNDGDNVINKTVISRFEHDDERGFAGNNRVSNAKWEYFMYMLSDSKVLLRGYNFDTIEDLNEKGVGAGVMSSMISIGLIGVLGLIFPYLYISATSSRKMYAWFFFLFFLFYMYQRSEATWICYVICYVYGIIIEERDGQSKLLST